MKAASAHIAPKTSVGNSKSLGTKKRTVGFATSGDCLITVNGKRHHARMSCNMRLVVSSALHREITEWSLRNWNPRFSGCLSLENELGNNGNGKEDNS
jgi:hypothetical protein